MQKQTVLNMKLAVLCLCLFAALGAFSLDAQAMPGGSSMMNARFDQLDTNKDGSVSWDEFHAGSPSMQRSAFDSIDTSSDGLISREEWQDFANQHMRDMAGEDGPMSMGNGKMPNTADTGDAAKKAAGLLPGIAADSK